MRTTRILLLAALCALAVPAAAGAAGRPRPLKLVAHDTSKPLRTMRATAHPRRFAPAPRRLAPFPVFRLPHPQVASTRRTVLAMPGALASFDGLATNGTTNPPDPTGDVGDTQYVQAVNGQIGVFSKTGTLLARADNSSFWSQMSGPSAAGLCATSPHGDPSVVYDSQAQRWVYSEFAFASTSVAPFVECIAVSKTADATGAWYRYVFQLSGGLLLDYPKLAVWSDGYYMSGNEYNTSGTYVGPGAAAFERSKMLLGQSAQGVYDDLSASIPSSFGMLASDLDGPTAPPLASPNYFVESNDAGDQLKIWAFSVNWTAPASYTFTQVGAALPVTAFDTSMCAGAASCIPQPGTGTGLDAVAGGQLMYRLQYRYDGSVQRLVVNQTVDVGSDHAGIRLYVLSNNGGGWSVAEDTTYAPDADNRFMGSAAMDGAGNIALAFSVSSASTYPSLRYTGWTGGVNQGEASLIAGPASQTAASRWGDYSDLTVDPTDDCTFWYTGEYYSGAGWSTRIGSFRFSGCTPSASARNTAVPTISGAAVDGQTLTLTNGAWVNTTGPLAHAWLRCDTHGFNCTALGPTGSSYTLTVADVGTTLRVRETASGVEALSAATAVVAGAVPTNTVAPVITGTLTPGGVLTVSDGTWTGSPTSYAYQWLRCGSNGSSCASISSAAAKTYVVAAADVGSTLRATVTATNSVGATSTTSAATTVVGASGTPPELGLTASFSPVPQKVGDTFAYTFTITNSSAAASTQSTLTVTVPSGIQITSTKTNRGTGCTIAGSAVTCPLGPFPAATTDSVVLNASAKATGVQTLSARLDSLPVDSNPANDSAVVTLTIGTTTAGGTTQKNVPLGRDLAKPKVGALASTAKAGKVAKLRFRIYDDRGVASAALKIKRGKKVVGSTKSGFGPVVYGLTYYLPWRVPKTLRGTLSFCVTARDRAGNVSKTSCARLRVS